MIVTNLVDLSGDVKVDSMWTGGYFKIVNQNLNSKPQIDTLISRSSIHKNITKN